MNIRIKTDKSVEEESNAMAIGTLKWFDVKKGFEYSEQNERPDAFVHHTGINATAFKTLDIILKG